MRELPSLPLLMLAAALSLAAATMASPEVRTEHARASFLSTVTSVAPGDSFYVALRLQPDSGWHVYWHNPGDAGMPPSLTWRLPAKWTAGPLLFPVPDLFETPPLASFGYKDDVWYPVKMVAGGGVSAPRVSLRVRAEWLICREECLPEAADFTVNLETGRTIVNAADSARVAAYALARLPLPPPDWDARAVFDDDEVTLSWDVGESFSENQSAYFFPAVQGVLMHAAPQTLGAAGDRARLTMTRDDVLRARPDTLRGVLVLSTGSASRGYELAVAAPPGADRKTGRLSVLIVGFLSLSVLILIFVLKRPHVGGAA
jgi:DsbC/DsbD-like thiol-disulfide interchange protein